MRILKVVPAFYPVLDFGGPIPVIRGSARHLIERGHEVTVWTTNLASKKAKLGDRTEERDVDGIRAVYLNSVARYRWVGITPEVFGYLRRELDSFDVVHFYGYRDFLTPIVALWARAIGKPYVVQALGTITRMKRSMRKKLLYDVILGRAVLDGAAAFVAKSPVEQRQYLDAGLPTQKIVLVPNGIEVLDVGALEPGKFRRTYGLDAGRPLVLSLGRIDPIKGLDLLIKAFAKLDDRAQLAIVGPDEGGYRRDLERLVARNALENRVVFTGPLYGEQKWEAYLDADVYALPSVFENFSYTTLEAMSCGTPTVITDRCGIAPLIEDQAGLVVPYEEEAFSRALDKLLEDSRLRERLGARGRHMVEEEFSWGPIVGQLEDMYEQAIGGSARR